MVDFEFLFRLLKIRYFTAVFHTQLTAGADGLTIGVFQYFCVVSTGRNRRTTQNPTINGLIMTQPEKFRAIVIDDEKYARENLAMLLEEYCPQVELAGTADGVEKGFELIESVQPDMVFLDIRMPSGAEGFDLLKKPFRHKFLVVFVTAFRDYAVEAFNANAIHYLLKPVDIEELTAAVNKVTTQLKHLNQSPDQFFDYQQKLELLMNELSPMRQRIQIHHSKGIKLIDPREIQYVEADGNCAIIHLRGGSKYLDTRTLKVYASLLLAKRFVRVHRSYLVNTEEVEELIRSNGVWLQMKNGQKIPVSRSRLAEFLKSISAA